MRALGNNVKIAVLVLLAMSLCSAAPALADIKRGAALAQDKCAVCHAIGERGVSANPKSPPFRTLNQRYPLRDLEEALAEGIVVGHDGAEMPEFTFSAGEIADLLAYMASIQERRAPEEKTR